MSTSTKRLKLGEFLYRDACNYKFTFRREIPAGVKLKVGDDIEYEKLGFTRKEFHKEIVGYKYDKTSDHNLVELVGLSYRKGGNNG